MPRRSPTPEASDASSSSASSSSGEGRLVNEEGDDAGAVTVEEAASRGTRTRPGRLARGVRRIGRSVAKCCCCCCCRPHRQQSPEGRSSSASARRGTSSGLGGGARDNDGRLLGAHGDDGLPGSGRHRDRRRVRSRRDDVISAADTVDSLVLETLAEIRTMVDTEQAPPEAMIKLHMVAERDPGWLLVLASMVRVIPVEDPLGPSTITLLLDECPLPSKELLREMMDHLNLAVVDWGSSVSTVAPEHVRMHHNVSIVLGCLAEKLAGPRSIFLLSDEILNYLVGNLNPRAHPAVILHTLVAIEKFSQTSENKVTIRRKLFSLDAHPLIPLEKMVGDQVDHYRRQVGFCARWSLDNLFLIPERPYSYLGQNTDGLNVMLNSNDVSEYLKLGPDGLEARCDASSFESVRSTFQVWEGTWFYEVEVITAGIMQIGWATKDSKFLNHDGYGIGDDDSSVAIDGCRQLLWFDAASQKVDAARWQPGDRIGTVLDLDRKLVAFFHNGRRVVVFDELFEHGSPPVTPERGFFAAASFMAFQQCRFNFGAEEVRFWPREWPPSPDGTQAVETKGRPPSFRMFNEHGTMAKDEKIILPRHLKLELLRQSSVREDACTLCFDRAADAALRPCGHAGLCAHCAAQLQQCPMCRADIDAVERQDDA